MFRTPIMFIMANLHWWETLWMQCIRNQVVLWLLKCIHKMPKLINIIIDLKIFNLKINMVIHTCEKPYECHIWYTLCICILKCLHTKMMIWKYTPYFTLLRNHINVMYEKSCAFYEYTNDLIQNVDLKIHMVIYTVEKPYDCHGWETMCMLKMPKWIHIIIDLKIVDLKINMVIHTCEKPYECHIWYTLCMCMLLMLKWFHTIWWFENTHNHSQWLKVIWISCLINHVHVINVQMTSHNLKIPKTAYSL